MQKNKIWIVLLFLFIGIFTLLWWLSPSKKEKQATNINTTEENKSSPTHNIKDLPYPVMTSQFSSQSQLDTEINCDFTLDGNQRLIVDEQTKNCFEYFITQFGEKNIDHIRNDFKKYIQQTQKEPAQSQIIDLWTRYFNYREGLGKLTIPTGIDPEHAAYYRRIYEDMKNLRKHFFSDYEIEGLFGSENIYHNYTLNRMDVLDNQTLNEQQKAEKLKLLFEQLPKDWQENLEQLNKLEDLRRLTADIKKRKGSEAEIHEMRVNLVGLEATERLEKLDYERQDWKNRTKAYLAERDSLLQSNLSNQAKNDAIQNLKNKSFNTPQEKSRVETFEQVYDQGQELPFPD